MKPITLVDHVENVNLSTLTQNAERLRRVAQHFALKHGQGVLFTNKARDRYRIVACWYGMAVLVLAPIDQQARLSLYLEVSRFLRSLSGSRVLENVEREILYTQHRIERAAKRSALRKLRER